MGDLSRFESWRFKVMVISGGHAKSLTFWQQRSEAACVRLLEDQPNIKNQIGSGRKLVLNVLNVGGFMA
jgi:hypothetical protein